MTEENAESGISVKRLRSLKELVDKYDPIYQNLSKLTPAERNRAMDELVTYYIPNILRDFPSVLNKIDNLKSCIKSNYDDYLFVEKQRTKAYNQLGWKIDKQGFFDPSESDAIFMELIEKEGQ